MILRDGTLVCALATAMLFASGAFAAPLEQTEEAEIRPVAEVVWVDKEFTNEHERRACEAGFLLETVVPEPALATEPAKEPAKLYTERDVELLAKVIWAEARGIESDAEKAAVAWCALNRLDAGFGETLEEVVTAPHQFAYRESAPVTPEIAVLARDMLERWQAERCGAVEVGRTLPADYYFFGGDGRHNYFRKEYRHTGENWDWSLPDPYRED